jgi:uncharacterized protein (TIGR02996 family)
VTTTTTTLAAMLRAVKAAPDDDTPRLILADALDETDPSEGGDAAWAELIRVQCELANHAHYLSIVADDYDVTDGVNELWQQAFDLIARSDALLTEHEARWRRGPACKWCWGKGRRAMSASPAGLRAGCPTCRGTGWTGPLGERDSVRFSSVHPPDEDWRHPAEFRRGFIHRVETSIADVLTGDDVTEWAVRVARWPCVCLEEWGLTDREPWELVGSSAGPNAGKPTFDWWADHEPDQDNPDRSLIPPTVLAKIISQNPEWHHANSGDWIECPTEAAARLALARAVAQVVREAAHD